MSPVVCAAFLLLLSMPAYAVEPEPAAPIDTIVVTATRTAENLARLPAALSVVGRDGLDDGRPNVSLDERLAPVPGAFAQSSGNFAQDVRLQIRGFGARSGFGVREVKLLLDGLPLTFADGQSELDEVDLAAIERIEVLRGAAAALYGNAAGGVVHFFTPSPRARAATRLRTIGGSFGLGKFQLAGSVAGRRGDAFLSVSSVRLDGYRDHSAAERVNLVGAGRFDIGPKTDVRVLLTGLDTLEAQDPGALTADEVHADRRQARPGAARFATGEEVLQGRLGTVLEHHAALGDVSAYGFTAYRDLESRLPIDPMQASPAQGGFITLHRLAVGGGVAGAVTGAWLIPAHTLGIGVDVQYQRDDRRRYENQNGNRGALGLDQREEVRSVGPYVRYAAQLIEEVEASIGVRYDHFRYDVSGADTDGGGRTLDAWSPAGGLRYTPWTWLTLFGDVGTAFQVPTTTELANPLGPGFNADVDPQTATATEVGMRLTRANIRASIVGFVTDVRDVLVPYELETQPGRTFYRNVGRARRSGLELEGQTALAALARDLYATTAFTLIDARFVNDFMPGCCKDQHEPGIPGWQFYGELAYRPERGVGAAFAAHLVDDLYVDDANTARSPQSAVCDVRLTYRHLWPNWTLLAALGLNNILNDQYDGRVRINAQGGRYFEPAPRFNVYGTVEVAWRVSE